MIKRLILFTLSTGLLTSLCAVGNVIAVRKLLGYSLGYGAYKSHFSQLAAEPKNLTYGIFFGSLPLLSGTQKMFTFHHKKSPASV